MKLIVAIINEDDKSIVASTLTENEIYFTVLNTSGGFLKKKNSTLLIGVEENRVNRVIDILKQTAKSQTISMPNNFLTNSVTTKNKHDNDENESNQSIEIGGGTVFILDVEKTIKL